MSCDCQNACGETVPGKIFEFFAADDNQKRLDADVADDCSDDHADEVNAKCGSCDCFRCGILYFQNCCTEYGRNGKNE